MVQLIHKFQDVSTEGEVAVEKTELLKIKIMLSDDAVPVMAPVHEIKPHLQENLQEQID